MAVRSSTDSCRCWFATERPLWSTRQATERPWRSATKATERFLSLATEKPVCQMFQCDGKLNKVATSEAPLCYILVCDSLLQGRCARTCSKDVNYRKKREREPSRINISQIFLISPNKIMRLDCSTGMTMQQIIIMSC